MPMSRFFTVRPFLSFLLRFFRWRPVGVEDGTEFQWLEQETVTNSSGTRHTIDNLQPYTVYTFSVTAVNTVGRSAASKQSYPAVTLMESEYNSGRKEGRKEGNASACVRQPIITLNGPLSPLGRSPRVSLSA